MYHLQSQNTCLCSTSLPLYAPCFQGLFPQVQQAFSISVTPAVSQLPAL